MHLIQLVSACLLAGLINPVFAFDGFLPRHFPYGGNYRNNRRPAPGPYPANTRTGSSGSGGYEGPTQNIFPFYLREIFAFKAHLATTKRTVASVENTLNYLKDDEIPDCLSDIRGLISGVLSQKNNAQKCSSANNGDRDTFWRDNTLSKCFHYFEDPVTYAQAKAACLESHGTLAVPNLRPGSVFGSTLKRAALLDPGDLVWIDGISAAAGEPVIRANGQDVSTTTHDRLDGTAADPGALTVVAPDDAPAGGPQPPARDWNFQITDPESTAVVGYVCEYKINLVMG